MVRIDHIAIIWTIAIVAAGVGFTSLGGSFSSDVTQSEPQVESRPISQQSTFSIGGITQQAAPVKSGSTGTPTIKFDKTSYVQTDQFYVEITCNAANTSNNPDSIIVTVNVASTGTLSGNLATLTATETSNRSGIFRTPLSSVFTLTNRVPDPQTMTSTATCGTSQLAATTTVLSSASITFSASSYETTAKTSVNIFCYTPQPLSEIPVTLSGPKSTAMVLAKPAAMAGTFYTDISDSSNPTAGMLADAGSQITATATCSDTSSGTPISAQANVIAPPTTQPPPISPQSSIAFSKQQYLASEKPGVLVVCPSVNTSATKQQTISVILAGPLNTVGVAVNALETAKNSGQFVIDSSTRRVPLVSELASTGSITATATCSGVTLTTNANVGEQVTAPPPATTTPSISFSKSEYTTTEKAGISIACPGTTTMSVTIFGPKSSVTIATLQGAMSGTFYIDGSNPNNPTIGTLADAGTQITATATCSGVTLTTNANVAVEQVTISPSISFSKQQYLTTEKPIVQITCPVAPSGPVTISGPKSSFDTVPLTSMPGFYYTSSSTNTPYVGDLANVDSQITTTVVCSGTTLSATALVVP